MEAVRPDQVEQEEEPEEVVENKPMLTPVQQFKMEREAKKTIEELNKEVDLDLAVEAMGENLIKPEQKEEELKNVPKVVAPSAYKPYDPVEVRYPTLT